MASAVSTNVMTEREPRPGQTRRGEIFSAQGLGWQELSVALAAISLKAVEDSVPQVASFELELIRASGLALGTCRFSEALAISPDPLGKEVLFLLERKACVEVEIVEAPAIPSNAIVVDPARPETFHLLTRNAYFILLINWCELRRRLIERSGFLIGNDFAFTPRCYLSQGGVASALLSIVSLTYRGLMDGSLRSSSPSVDGLCETILQLLLEAIPHPLSSTMEKECRDPLPRSVKRAIAFMQQRLSEPVTLDDLALAAGVSLRSLQRDFQNFKSTSPMLYLKFLRLEAAHQMLSDIRHGQTIAEIATACGFKHLSRFAADYRIRFGKLPSDYL
ncbi:MULTISPECIES: helix-turn-helix domain-containing protein [unclassified Rhizobium]|uniref:helix-turn-helix domain-containing protein n=1 Tax=unclassified Rhizobium TaxID=2613769 RepID=UPI000BE8C260|nr:MULTISPECIES: helix-turn-helix domain-containing protein [unclassified Rhizobium]MDF0661672.1 AraC family transcriptional regulator [Rhizobium sp. BC49]PDS87524.1 hypothetical protein CO654_03515 [Rhizobium sp. L18]